MTTNTTTTIQKTVLILLCISFFYLLVRSLGSSETKLIVESPNKTLDSLPITKIKVDVSGAVEQPGVYSLTEGSRIVDAISLAGGVTSLANVKYISKDLNLAGPLSDAHKVYIPFEWESNNTATASVEELKRISSTTAADQSILALLNTMTKDELLSLSGVGEVYSEKIIEGRPYTTLDDLVLRGGLSEKLFESIVTELEK